MPRDIELRRELRDVHTLLIDVAWRQRRIQRFLEHMIADPAAVAEMSRQLEKTTDALERAVERNTPEED
jgi:hypothetical protein